MRRGPSLRTIKRLFAYSDNCCAFPSCVSQIAEDSGEIAGVISHIKAWSKGGPRYDPKQTNDERNAFDNLILLCYRHSKLIDSEPGKFSVPKLINMKHEHEQHGSIEITQSDARKAARLLETFKDIHIAGSGQVMVNSPGAVQARNVVIKNQKSSIQVLPPNESIGSDLSKRNYVKHLIDRYNEFAKNQPKRTFQFSRIYVNIKTKFGAKWDFVPLHRFEDLISHLRDKIDGTMLGRMNHGKGMPNYSDYEGYRKKYDHSP